MANPNVPITEVVPARHTHVLAGARQRTQELKKGCENSGAQDARHDYFHIIVG